MIKNLFQKHPGIGVLIGATGVGIAISGGLVWLFLTDKGTQVLNGWKATLKEKSKDVAADILCEKTGISKSVARPVIDAVVN